MIIIQYQKIISIAELNSIMVVQGVVYGGD